jgi:hypothetical protein
MRRFAICLITMTIGLVSIVKSNSDVISDDFNTRTFQNKASPSFRLITTLFRKSL